MVKTIKAKVVKVNAGYKDIYSGGSYPSEKAFLEMKLKHLKSKFTRLFNCLDKKAPTSKGILIKVKDLGIDYVDARLPRYVTSFMPKYHGCVIKPVKSNSFTKSNGGTVSGLVEFSISK